jgi:hypothetical protein
MTDRDLFHLAIPVDDLAAAEVFYVTKLGCHLARRYPDRITVEFFGHQVVCHLWDRIESEPELYPRHFGMTFRHRDSFDALLRLVANREIPVFRAVETRFGGAVEEHLTVVLRDPSNNLLEFKHYIDPRMMY